MRQTLRGKRCEELIQEIGPDVTFEQVDHRLHQEGLGPIHEMTFLIYKRKTFPRKPPMSHEANGQPAVVTQPPAKMPSTIPDRVGELDYLEKFVRFGVAVVAAGGIDAAQRMLDAMRQLRGESR